MNERFFNKHHNIAYLKENCNWPTKRKHQVRYIVVYPSSVNKTRSFQQGDKKCTKLHLCICRSSGRSHHRRTPSNSSNTPTYRNTQHPDAAPEEHWNTSDHHYPRKFSRQSSYTSPMQDLERPQTLELPLTPRTPLRSSLRKNSASYNRYAMGGGSSGGTPTNPTPPDSLSEEVSASGVTGGMPTMGASRSDSGFVSTSNRVRFSPSPYEKGGGVYVTDWSPTHEPPRATPKSPFPMQRSGGRSTTPSSTHHYITESDLQRDFNLYPQT